MSISYRVVRRGEALLGRDRFASAQGASSPAASRYGSRAASRQGTADGGGRERLGSGASAGGGSGTDVAIDEDAALEALDDAGRDLDDVGGGLGDAELDRELAALGL